MAKDLNKLTQDIQQIYDDVRSWWSELSKNNPQVRHYGYSILLGPPKKSPPFLIVSLNPGASDDVMSHKVHGKKGRLRPDTWPESLSYLDGVSKFSKQLKNLFDGVDGVELNDCCATHIHFLRSREWKRMKSELELSNAEFKQSQEFCRQRLDKIIQVISPKTILTFGKDAFDNLVPNPKQECWSLDSNGRPQRIAAYGSASGTLVIGLRHLSRPMPSQTFLRYQKLLSSLSNDQFPENRLNEWLQQQAKPMIGDMQKNLVEILYKAILELRSQAQSKSSDDEFREDALAIAEATHNLPKFLDIDMQTSKFSKDYFRFSMDYLRARPNLQGLCQNIDYILGSVK